jgi:hypothetical protein
MSLLPEGRAKGKVEVVDLDRVQGMRVTFEPGWRCQNVSNRYLGPIAERLVSDPHSAVTQLERSPLFTRHRLEVVKSIRRLFGCRLERIPSRVSAAAKKSEIFSPIR